MESPFLSESHWLCTFQWPPPKSLEYLREVRKICQPKTEVSNGKTTNLFHIIIHNSFFFLLYFRGNPRIQRRWLARRRKVEMLHDLRVPGIPSDGREWWYSFGTLVHTHITAREWGTQRIGQQYADPMSTGQSRRQHQMWSCYLGQQMPKNGRFKGMSIHQTVSLWFLNISHILS